MQSDSKSGAPEENVKNRPAFKKQRPKPARRPLDTQSDWQPPTSTDYPPNTATDFRHGFRPPASQNGYNRFNRNPDQQRSGVQNSSRFQARGGGRGGQTQGYKLRAPRSEVDGTFQSGGPGQPRHYPNKQGPHRHVAANGATPNNRQQTVNYTKSLEEYFSQMDLGTPEFKTSKMEKKVSVGGRSSKKGTTMKYCSSVKVNNKRFQTYPNEYNTEQEAEEAAAKLACENLGIGTPGGLHSASGVPTSPTPSQIHSVTSDSIDTIIERVFDLVSNRPNGVWSNKVETEYEEKFGHGLPENWPSKIELHQSSGRSQRKINVEKPIPDRAIIMPCIEMPKVPQHSDIPSSITKQTSAPGYSHSDVLSRSLPMTLPPPNYLGHSQPKLPELVLPEENIWDVYVTHIFSTVEVCIRLLGDDYSTVYEDLITEMELHYYDASKIPQVNNPIVGRMYAAVLDNNEVHRVEVVSVKGIEVTCYFMDHGGDHVTLDLRSLREMDQKFLKLAAQAKKVRLAGLEGFAQNQTAHNELIKAALARSLVAQVHTRNANGDISLILVDTSGQEKDVNINEKLLKELRELPSSPLSPVLPKNLNTSVLSPPRVASPGNLAPIKTSVLGSTESDLMSLDLASLKPLILPEVPGLEQFFDVNITLAASPSNFTVQPYKDTTELERLMASMRDFYGNEKKRITLTTENLSKDIYFAALHTDGSWYRVKINSQLDSCTLAAKLVDYGEFSMLPIHNMQPLWPQFRNLPMQAISATLNKIVGANGDWSTEDTVWFARRVVNKSFVSIIKAVTFDDIEQNYKISVSLADTSDPTEDVYIEHELVNSGRALPLCD